MASKLILIGIGGGLGSVLRYLLAGLVQRGWPGFPVGTLVVNLVGSFLIGLLATTLPGTALGEHQRLAILVGVLGGFTTFSTFSYETLMLADDRDYRLAAANVLGTVCLCLIGVWAGQRLGKWMVGA